MPLLRGTSGSVTTMTMMNEAVFALEEKNLQPFITQSSPSRTARVRNWVGSEPALGLGHREGGEHLAVEQRLRYCSFCSAVPKRAMISAFPVSGAWQPKITGAQDDRPRISFSRQSRTSPCPCPPSSGPRCVAHSPCVPDRLLERVDDLPDRVARRRVRQVRPDQVEWLDVLAHERVRPVELLLVLGLGREIPRHRAVSLASDNSPCHLRHRPQTRPVTYATDTVKRGRWRSRQVHDPVDGVADSFAYTRRHERVLRLAGDARSPCAVGAAYPRARGGVAGGGQGPRRMDLDGTSGSGRPAADARVRQRPARSARDPDCR